jgi:hypothetical protein
MVGLGGTGIKAILNAKKMFYENYGQIPPMIGFIGIDTDAPGLQNNFVIAKDGTKISLTQSEQLRISVEKPLDIYKVNSNNKLFDWMPECNVSGLSALSIGAGQMRSNGRFAITVNENNVIQTINRKITEVNNARIIDNSEYDLLGKDTEVHMVFSLGGGTGSGTFINTAYLIKRMFPSIKLSGYAVLPDVFRTMAASAMTARVKPNGKGAIIDIDYLAHLTPNSDPIDIKWFHTNDKVSSRPFNALYFIDNANENNDMFDSVDPLCQMIALAIVTSVGELGVALDSVSDNVSKLIADGTMDIKNKKAWVAGLGCAEIIFDGERLANIYARKATTQLINKMLNGGCDDPAIIANNWFDNTKIRENLGKDDVTDYFMQPAPTHAFSDIDEPDNPLNECNNYIANIAVDKQAKLDEKLERLEVRVDKALSDLLKEQANRECGIFLCQQILLTIKHQIELCNGEMKQEKENLEEREPKAESALKTACSELAACMDTFLKRNRKDYEQEVINNTTKYATLRREIVRRKTAIEFYDWLGERVNRSIHNVDIIISNLQNLRGKCGKEIQELQLLTGSGNFFQFDLTDNVVNNVACPLSDIVFNDFVKAMEPKGGITIFSSMETTETEAIVEQYIRTLPKVKEYASMTVDNILDKLSEDELKSLISNAIKKSLPLLPYTFRGYDADLKERPVECYYIGVANKDQSRLAKGNMFQSLVPGAKDVQFSEVGLSNRIIIYRQLGVIPAFAVKSLDNYETEYEKWEGDKPHGSHWDEALCQRMAKERFSLMPKDVNSKHTFESWITAIVYDIIKYNDTTKQYQIKSRGLGGKALRGWWVDMGANRTEAFNFMEDNIDILDGEIKQTIKEMDVPGPDNPIRRLSEAAVKACQNGTYLQEISKCPISIETIEHYPAEEELIEKEMEYIIDNINK